MNRRYFEIANILALIGIAAMALLFLSDSRARKPHPGSQNVGYEAGWIAQKKLHRHYRGNEISNITCSSNVDSA